MTSVCNERMKKFNLGMEEKKEPEIKKRGGGRKKKYDEAID